MLWVIRTVVKRDGSLRNQATGRPTWAGLSITGPAWPGLEASSVAVGDEVLGLWSVLGEVYPTNEPQRCWNQWSMNVQEIVPKNAGGSPRTSARNTRSQDQTRPDSQDLRDSCISEVSAEKRETLSLHSTERMLSESITHLLLDSLSCRKSKITANFDLLIRALNTSHRSLLRAKQPGGMNGRQYRFSQLGAGRAGGDSITSGRSG